MKKFVSLIAITLMSACLLGSAPEAWARRPFEASSWARRDSLRPLYQRIARDLAANRPLVVTVHVALCDNRIINCGKGGLGNGDVPARNLYWGGAAGFRAYFDYVRKYRRVHLDAGDGQTILERAVYRRRVSKPSAAWRRLGAKKPFDILVVGLAYRGTKIGRANAALIDQVSQASPTARNLTLKSGQTIAIGARGHIVGYAGHNHMMDLSGYRFPKKHRKEHIGYFALSCKSADYLARPLHASTMHALLLTRVLMYPGAFTIEGLVEGLAKAESQEGVFLSGVRKYARFQKRKEALIRRVFTHGAEKRFRRRYLDE